MTASSVRVSFTVQCESQVVNQAIGGSARLSVSLQSKYVSVLVVPRHLLRESVGIRADGCAFAVGSVQHPVQAVIREPVSSDGGFVPRLPRHAADVSVAAGRAAAVRVVQALQELVAADSCQPVRAITVWHLRLQASQVVFVPIFVIRILNVRICNPI